MTLDHDKIFNIHPVDNRIKIKSAKNLKNQILKEQIIFNDSLNIILNPQLELLIQHVDKEKKSKSEDNYKNLVLPKEHLDSIFEFITDTNSSVDNNVKKPILILKVESGFGQRFILKYIAKSLNLEITLSEKMRNDSKFYDLFLFNKQNSSRRKIFVCCNKSEILNENHNSPVILLTTHSQNEIFNDLSEYYHFIDVHPQIFENFDLFRELFLHILQKHGYQDRTTTEIIRLFYDLTHNKSPRNLDALIARIASKAQIRGLAFTATYLISEFRSISDKVKIYDDKCIISPKVGLEDIVWDADIEIKIKKAIQKIRHITSQNYKFIEKFDKKSRFVGLFAGESGTGKSISAEVIAKELNRGLYKLDFANIQSMFVGMTEKLLTKAFEMAEEKKLVLLMDECDAFLSNRNGVIANSYSNKITNHLLNLIENYKGVLLLTTNYSDKIDPAFARRIDSIIEFKIPTQKLLAAALHKMLMPDAPLVENFNFESVFSEHQISYGLLRIVLDRIIQAIELGEMTKIDEKKAIQLVSQVYNENKLLQLDGGKRIGF